MNRLLVALWLVAVTGGFFSLLLYDSRECAPNQAPADWPSPTSLELATEGITVVMFVHPHCPCTQASLVEFNRLLLSNRKLRGRVVISLPPGVSEEWSESSLTDYAGMLVDDTLVLDQGLLETSRFRVFTSGDMVAYTASGELIFQGGITNSRGHQGDSPGRAFLLKSESAERGRFPVFGCPLGEASDFCGHEKDRPIERRSFVSSDF